MVRNQTNCVSPSTLSWSATSCAVSATARTVAFCGRRRRRRKDQSNVGARGRRRARGSETHNYRFREEES
ncbi:hypothetical protein MYCTH_2308086 [Thermothelomyces thermophilus ATCC 42464]|uniref:Uncharacterized protein n=1 Tax=Thermothelomyces thermophilus (strain ATCC 42464 / BCRC 31852 / DSM 1799) TaxID=573729 RepID=G2QJ52_THET4|nr:uncharacterized protein MYCTH_2308086 [Thermothelomyces thermophilus ATCC 42464]AEO59627.1 hypothetical protein MYCTH_2308086 [Thermothelomyces thermophilus ATCC 42464]